MKKRPTDLQLASLLRRLADEIERKKVSRPRLEALAKRAADGRPLFTNRATA